MGVGDWGMNRKVGRKLGEREIIGRFVGVMCAPLRVGRAIPVTNIALRSPVEQPF